MNSFFRFRYFFNQSSSIVSRMSNQWSNPREIQIPVSYGFIAAKAWGSANGEPVLALHGWQDNAGTFDRLIPLLTSNLSIVAIDAPGHGLSSHKPKGAFYHYMEILVDIKRVVNHLKWTKFSIIGHSLGGTIAVLYGSLYPESVKNIVLLDIIKPASRPTHQLPDVTKEGIDELLSVEKKLSEPAPVYSLKEAQSRLFTGLYNQVSEESVSILLKRGCKQSDCGTGVVFSRDIRVKATEELQKLSHDDLKAFLNRIRCNMLIILGNNSGVFRSRTPDVLDDFLKLYEENCKYFKVVKVEGNHFVHLDHPERVAPHVDEFFKFLNNVSKM